MITIKWLRVDAVINLFYSTSNHYTLSHLLITCRCICVTSGVYLWIHSAQHIFLSWHKIELSLSLMYIGYCPIWGSSVFSYRLELSSSVIILSYHLQLRQRESTYYYLTKRSYQHWNKLEWWTLLANGLLLSVDLDRTFYNW